MELVAPNGDFMQTGGTHTAGSLVIGQLGHGSYSLSGGELSVSGYEIVGHFDTLEHLRPASAPQGPGIPPLTVWVPPV